MPAVKHKPTTLRDLLDRAGRTLEDIAKLTGLSERTIRLLRDGVVADPRSTTVHALAVTLGVTERAVRAAISASRDARE